MTEQYQFDFSDGTQNQNTGLKLQLRDLRRAAAAWLVTRDARAIAMRVPTRVSSYMADVAGFWSKTVRHRRGNGYTRILKPETTVIIECRRSRKECWPDCTNSEQLAPRLRELNRRRDALESEIRKTEPNLQACDMLFEEFAEWDYAQSNNQDYHELCRQIQKTEDALYKGTKLETTLQAEVADRCYLAVPQGTVQKGEVAHGWGLLWVAADLNVQEVASAVSHKCEPENRLHLIQNIAAAGSQQVLFAAGIDNHDDLPRFRPPPRRRPFKRKQGNKL